MKKRVCFPTVPVLQLRSRAEGVTNPTNSSARAPGNERRTIVELDGLRALAIWFVLIAHLFFTYPANPIALAWLPRPVVAILGHGWLGVDLFFVLSGFLITGILLRTKRLGRAAYFRHFYTRRALRILPVYLIVLAALAIAYGKYYTNYFILCALLSANIAPLFHINIPGGAGPYWSLAVEEQFYLFWPWLVLWLDTRKVAIAAVLVIVAEPIVRALHPGDLEFTWYRTDGLAMGAFIAAWFDTWDGDRRAARNLALTLVGIPIAIAIVGIPFGILHAGEAGFALRISQAVMIFGALVVCAVAFRGHRALGILRSPIFVWTASLSFALYLVHRPLVDAFGWSIGSTGWFAHLSLRAASLVRAGTVIIAAYVIAMFSRRFIENPFLRLGR